MSETRWEQLERLFESGLQQPPEQRAEWLAQLTVEKDLLEELAAMLHADQESQGITRRFDHALVEAGDSPLPGTRLGAYRLIRELGQGGMGVVFLAERADEQFRQQVAIKLIRSFGSHDAAKQLRHERQILAELDHPGIARLLDGGETSRGQPYLVMEFVPGEPVTQAAQKKALPLNKRVELLRDIARAVHYAHQRLIVHRDIKPANVLLREDGRPVLLDFGIAKLVDRESQLAHATQPWFTPAYASPEQRRGAPLSTATDVYALGLLLSELLTDTLPAADHEGVPPLPSTVAPPARRRALRGDLDRIVLRATAPDPARRYSSASGFADDLQRFLDGKPVRATPDSLAYRTRKMLRRHPYGAVAALVAVALLAWSAYTVVDERDRALQAEQRATAQAQAAEAVTDFLTDLFREADPENARGTKLSPTELIDRGRERLARETKVTPRQRTRLLGALGEIYTNLGQPAKASKTLREAVDVAKQADMDSALQADLWQQLGKSLGDRAVYKESEEAYAKALELRLVNGDRLAAARLKSLIGLARSRQNRLKEAEPILKEAQRELEQLLGPKHPDTLEVQTYLAELMRMDGRQEEAEPVMASAATEMRKKLPPDSAQLLTALGFQAELLRELGKTAEAEAVLLEMLEHRARIQERDSNQLALVHSALGSVYYEQGKTREATAQLLEALHISERTLSPTDPSLGIDYNNVAALYEEQGDYPSAEPLMRRALTIAEASAADQPVLQAQYRQNLGRLLMLAGNSAEARQWLEMPIEGTEGEGFRAQRWRQHLHLAEWERRYGDAAKAREHVAAAEASVADVGGTESARYAQLLRTRGLLAQADGDLKRAEADLGQGLLVLRASRGERYVGVGELILDLAILDHMQKRHMRARDRLEQAWAILAPVLAETAPQRKRISALAAANLK